MIQIEREKLEKVLESLEDFDYDKRIEAITIIKDVLEQHDSVQAKPEPEQKDEKGRPLTDEEIDAVTDAQWAKCVNKPIYAAHRAYARAIEAAHGIFGDAK